MKVNKNIKVKRENGFIYSLYLWVENQTLDIHLSMGKVKTVKAMVRQIRKANKEDLPFSIDLISRFKGFHRILKVK